MYVVRGECLSFEYAYVLIHIQISSTVLKFKILGNALV